MVTASRADRGAAGLFNGQRRRRVLPDTGPSYRDDTCGPADRLRALVRTVVEERVHDLAGVDTAGGHQQWRAAVQRSHVRIGTALEQQSRHRWIVHGPEQRGCAGIVANVWLRSHVEQQSSRCCVSIERGVHQRRDATGSGGVSHLRVPLQQLLDPSTIAEPKRVQHLRRQRILRRRRRLSGELVGPFGALIDPRLDRGDLLGPQRAGRRHLQSRLATGHSTIQPAHGAVARDDARVVGADTIGHRVAAAIEPEISALQRCAVAAVAVGAKQRLHVARVIDSLGRLRGRSYQTGRRPLRPATRGTSPGVRFSSGGNFRASGARERSLQESRSDPKNHRLRTGCVPDRGVAFGPAIAAAAHRPQRRDGDSRAAAAGDRHRTLAIVPRARSGRRRRWTTAAGHLEPVRRHECPVAATDSRARALQPHRLG